MATVLVLHGPNARYTGAADIDALLSERASELGVDLVSVAANGEAALIDALETNRGIFVGAIVSPGAIATIAYGLAEALVFAAQPAVEVLLSNIPDGRGPSALAGAVALQIHGEGRQGFIRALEEVVKRIAPGQLNAAAQVRATPQPLPGVRKSIGRAAVPNVERIPVKTLGRRAPLPADALTAAGVAKKLRLALAERQTRVELGRWARTEWSKLQAGGPYEPGRRDQLDSILLGLSSSHGMSDDELVSALAKLET